MRGLKQPEECKQLCEHIHFRRPVETHLTPLEKLYAYYPVTVADKDRMPESLVRTSENVVSRIDIDTWLSIATTYLEVMMEMLTETGGMLQLPENCGELQMAKMRKYRLLNDNVRVDYNKLDREERPPFEEFLKDHVGYRYHKNNGYQPVFHWKKRTYNLIRYRQMFKLVMNDDLIERIHKQWDDDPGLIYNLKTFNSIPPITNSLKQAHSFKGYNLDQ